MKNLVQIHRGHRKVVMTDSEKNCRARMTQLRESGNGFKYELEDTNTNEKYKRRHKYRPH